MPKGEKVLKNFQCISTPMKSPYRSSFRPLVSPKQSPVASGREKKSKLVGIETIKIQDYGSVYHNINPVLGFSHSISEITGFMSSVTAVSFSISTS